MQKPKFVFSADGEIEVVDISTTRGLALYVASQVRKWRKILEVVK